MLPGKNILNVGALVVFGALTLWFVIDPRLWLLVLVTVSQGGFRVIYSGLSTSYLAGNAGGGIREASSSAALRSAPATQAA